MANFGNVAFQSYLQLQETGGTSFQDVDDSAKITIAPDPRFYNAVRHRLVLGKILLLWRRKRAFTPSARAGALLSRHLLVPAVSGRSHDRHAGCISEPLGCGMIGDLRGPWPFRVPLGGGNYAGSRTSRSMPGPDCSAVRALPQVLSRLTGRKGSRPIGPGGRIRENEEAPCRALPRGQAIQSFFDAAGHVVDCIPFDQQPSVRAARAAASLCTSTCHRLHTLARATPILRTRVNPSARPRRRVNKAHRCALRVSHDEACLARGPGPRRELEKLPQKPLKAAVGSPQRRPPPELIARPGEQARRHGAGVCRPWVGFVPFECGVLSGGHPRRSGRRIGQALRQEAEESARDLVCVATFRLAGLGVPDSVPGLFCTTCLGSSLFFLPI